MKKIAFTISLIFCLFFITSCGVNKIINRVGVGVGQSYIELAQNGTITAEESIKAWPYISGQIKGALSANYAIELPVIMKNIISKLDKLSTKESLSEEEKGFVIGSFCRLETLGIKLAWDKYGVSITKALGF